MYEDTCSADCDRGAPLRRGMCNKHYLRWWKANRDKARKNASEEPESRFWKKVDRRGDAECWPWLAATDKGYGRFWVGDKPFAIPAPRYAYELLVGPIPDGLTIDHLCRNTICVNPGHMEPVTLEENSRREMEARPLSAHCVVGHAFTPENTEWRSDNGGRRCKTCRQERAS